ncbi:hypothetical protein Poly51_42700 [Rubripirellula tenax]|uniref:Uncharacterized protein n=1 Tax=Rubripirellula tenax TaxID=2528015 RepID=A0A5C6ES96_9BACT|nr:hypothetical protein Poly51_42700 [Rubripirellula tenax]
MDTGFAEHLRQRQQQIGGNSLQCLDASLLINRDRLNPVPVIKLDGITVGVADFQNRSVPSIGIINLWEKPVRTSMRQNIGAI